MTERKNGVHEEDRVFEVVEDKECYDKPLNQKWVDKMKGR